MARICALVVGAGSLAAQEGGAPDRTEKWRAALGAEEFEEREAATKELWALGDEALEVVEKLKEGDDPEVVSRARILWRKIRLGLTPDTPPRLERLLVNFLTGNPGERLGVLQQLANEKEYDYLLRLRKGESDPMVLRELDQMINRIMPEIVGEYLQEGEIDKARELLAVSDRFDHLIQLGHLLQLQGDLEGEIERLKPSPDSSDQARYLAYLRVKGDAGLLRREAERLGDRKAETVAALAEGDFRPYFRDLMDSPETSPAGLFYLQWVLARDEGDEGAAKRAHLKMLELAEGGAEGALARMNLFRMGYGEKVIEDLPPTRSHEAARYHQLQEEYVRVEKLLGLPPAAQIDEWVARWKEVVTKEGKNETGKQAYARLLNATKFLEARGRVDEACKVVLALFDLARDDRGMPRDELMRSLYYEAPISLLTGVAREIDEFEQIPLNLLKDFVASADSYVWLYSLLGEEAPKLTIRERLLLAFSFAYRHPLVPVAQYEEFFERVFERTVKSEDAADDLGKLLQLLLYRNRGEELQRVMEAREEAGSPEEYRRALLALDRKKMEEAADRFRKLMAEADGSTPLDHLNGLISLQVGREEGAEIVRKAKFLTDGGPEILEAFSENHLRIGQREEAHEVMKAALLRSEALPVQGGDYSPTSGIIEQLAEGAFGLSRWEEAVGFREVVALLASFRPEVEYGLYHMRDRFGVLVARGALAMQNGEVEKAVEAFGEAHRILPRDGYLANELFPVMRQVGLSEYHDQLFAESARHAREMIRLFPKDDNAYNNFAWMASRANRCLDEAEGYLKIALEMNPQSAAYLDTMGEIYFARRNREEAIKWSDRSLANETMGYSSSRWELHQQNERFRHGPFPPR